MSARTFLNSRYTGSDGDHFLYWSDWLACSFLQFLKEGEAFSGKRPLGNSDWQSFLTEELEEHKTSVEDVIEYLFKGKDQESDWTDFPSPFSHWLEKYE